MENSGVCTSKKRHPRRRVADNISRSPASSSGNPNADSPATKLLAALSRAQGKSAPDTLLCPTKHGAHGPRPKIDPIISKLKPESKRKGGLQNQVSFNTFFHIRLKYSA
ncbi:hypothetical protein NECAME_05543 [Necator americanus]|uniref:Uncharacterized protein n=1 Tax=Necator americanus TaxID=51031 RepID=W2SG28_NECAM|nr:hypothetical protein NECAME_05543 [Necator americanus]ETN68579.1 hypothetical protein NECAME_05543 [Necator americanus]